MSDEEVKTEIVDDEKKKNNKNNNSTSLDDVIKLVDNLPLWAKVIIALPFLDVLWHVYRILKSVSKNDTLGIVLAVLIIVIGVPFFWIIDMICIAVNGHIWWID